jgi:hypothetical protein
VLRTYVVRIDLERLRHRMTWNDGSPASVSEIRKVLGHFGFTPVEGRAGWWRGDEKAMKELRSDEALAWNVETESPP